jgi:hypothetical protein
LLMQQWKQFIIFQRDEFKEWLLKTQFKRPVKILQNHNTASPAYAHFNGKNHFELCDGMKRNHVEDRKFQDIAQNITTFPDGLIMVCRNLDVDPAGITGANKGAICMEHLGWFDKSHDVMTPEHQKTIVFLNAVLCMKYMLQPNPQVIVYHAWYNRDTGLRDNEGANKQGNYKTCPGTAFFGGNSVASMTKNFLPIVVKEIETQTKPKPMTSAELATFLNQKDVISNLKLGIEKAMTDKYVHDLMSAMVKYIKLKG